MAKATKKNGELNPRQHRFAQEYCKDLNVTRAMIRAGYSEKYANALGYKLLEHIGIQAAIAEEQARLAQNQDVTAERVIKEMAALAFLDPRKFYAEDGTLKPIKDLDRETAAALTGMDVDEIYAGSGEDRTAVGVTKKIKYAQKVKSLELLAKHLNLFSDLNVNLNSDALNALLSALPGDFAGRVREALARSLSGK